MRTLAGKPRTIRVSDKITTVVYTCEFMVGTFKKRDDGNFAVNSKLC